MFAERDLIPISALQHFLYCPRQCALIHIEREWTESQDTVQGNILHERVHDLSVETRKDVRTVTAMPISSREYGLVGIADVVEFHAGMPYPVEYKKGRPKNHDADRVQLYAQALCLEEMMGLGIPEGFLYYGAPRRREQVRFDQKLRTVTEETISAVREMLDNAQLPASVYSSQLCRRCSLIDKCQPRANANVKIWLDAMLEQF